MMLRRHLLLSAAGGSLLPSILRAQSAPAAITRDAARPLLPSGLQSGDVLADRAIVWARASRDARMWIEWSTTSGFANPTRVRGPDLLMDSSDGTGRIDLQGLPAGQDIFYRVVLEDFASANVRSPAVQGHFRTPLAAGMPATRPLRLVWSGDTAGQGFGINEAFGGMRIYEAMRRTDPDVFLHSGDTIYADGPIAAQMKLRDGTLWKNLVTPEVAKVAETLDEFRGRHRYNLMDVNVRALGSEVAQIWQWDDHEVTNNWWPGEPLTRPEHLRKKYEAGNSLVLAARAARAFHEYMPMRFEPAEPGRVYRKISYGPLLDVFLLDMRSYRGPNGTNDETEESARTQFLGPQQVAWLKRELKASRATWKAIAADMPLGLVVTYDTDRNFGSEAVAQGDGPPLGRELEIAGLLRFIRDEGIRNTVWFTADVHYTAAHYYDPNKARFQDFAPFWEFVSGPLHAGTFGPNRLDDTFGPQLRYIKAPEGGRQNLSPAEGYQFFGHVAIEGATRRMTVTLKDAADTGLWSTVIDPA